MREYDYCENCGHYRKEHLSNPSMKPKCDHLYASDERCICPGFREEPKDAVQRYHESAIHGGRPVNRGEWKQLLTHALMMNQREHERMGTGLYEPVLFDHHRRSLLPELHLAISYRMVMDLEATFAELDMLAGEMERVGKTIMSEVYREKLMETIAEVRGTIEKRKRLHLKVVP